MINPETVNKLQLLHKLVSEKGSNDDIKKMNSLIQIFEENETLTTVEAKRANKLYRKLK